MKEVKLKIGLDISGIKDAVRGANQAQENIFTKHAQLLERAANQRGRMLLKAGGLGAQMMGQSTLGYAMRMSSVAGIGTEVIGGMSAAALAGAGAALGALSVASKLVEVGFEALSSVVTSTAGAFIGAITSLGGARSLQGSIEASAKREDIIGGARSTVSEEERLSPRELEERSRRFKGFTSEEGLEAFGETGRYAAKQKSITQEDQDFLSKFALSSKDPSTGKADLKGTAHLWALLQAQGNTSEQSQAIMRDAMAIGQHTSFGPADVIAHAGITEMTAELGGDNQQNYRRVFGLEGGINKYTGNVNRSTTEAQALITGLKNAEGKGHVIGPVDEKGRFTDINESISQVAAMNQEQRKEIGFGHRMEAGKALDDLAKGAENAGQSIKEYLDSMDAFNITQQQLNDTAKENYSTVNSLTDSFKEIDAVLGDATKEELKKLAIALAVFAADFPQYKQDIKEFVETLGTSIVNFARVTVRVATSFSEAMSPAIELLNNINGVVRVATDVHRAAYKYTGFDWLTDQLEMSDPEERKKDEAATDAALKSVDNLTKNGTEPITKALQAVTDAADKAAISLAKLHGNGNPPPQPDTDSTTGKVYIP